MKTKSLAVCVVRLQVPELHDGHRYLLDTITTMHETVLVVIGETEARLTKDDPLTYEMRRAMLKAAYPNVLITRLADQPLDVLWSLELDEVILRWLVDLPEALHPVLYGGRNSFLQHYSGRCRTFELPPAGELSGTALRASVEPRNTEDFRRGMIYATKHKYPMTYMTVDIAIIDRDGNIVLGRKNRDGGRARFVGGHVSVTDPTLEAAAKREAREETGLEPGAVMYLGSFVIDDFRYRDTGDRIMTALFAMRPMFGAAVAADDLDSILVVEPQQLLDVIVPEHTVLAHTLLVHLNQGVS
jgi:bifunctional NMN adenylyltransferase/nudix hydrolase